MLIFIVIIAIIAIIILPKLIKIFGNETFDYDKATGRTVRKAPEQKALRFKIYAILALIALLCFMVAKWYSSFGQFLLNQTIPIMPDDILDTVMVKI